MALLESGIPGQQDLQEFYQWKQKKRALANLKRLSRYFALACLLEFFIVFLLQGIFSPFAEIVYSSGTQTVWVDLINEVFYIACAFLAFLPPYLLYAKISKLSVQKFPLERVNAPVTLAAAGIALAVIFIGNIMGNFILGFFSSFGMTPTQLPGAPLGGVPLLLNIISIVLIAPALEEIVYRGILLTSLRPFGDGFSIFMSALIFGLVHGNMTQFPFAFLMGLVMGYFVVKTNSIYTSIFIHLLNNAFALLFELLARQLNDFSYFILLGIENMLFVVLGLVGFLYLFVIRRVRWRLGTTKSCLRLGESVRNYFTTLPMILVLTYTIIKILGSFA